MGSPSSTSHPTPSQFFSISVAEKLDDSNYLHWKQQVEPFIKAHKLHRSVSLMMMITNIEQLILPMKNGKPMTKFCLRGCNLPSPRVFYLVFLMLFTPIKYGSIFMIISLPKQKHMRVNFVLIFKISVLSTSPCMTS